MYSKLLSLHKKNLEENQLTELAEYITLGKVLNNKTIFTNRNLDQLINVVLQDLFLLKSGLRFHN